MQELTTGFLREAQAAQVALFYFAGHGESHAEGAVSENFLLPVDVMPGQGQGNFATSIPVTSTLLNPLANSIESRINIIILDACRTKSVTRNQGIDMPVPSLYQGGLATMSLPSGTFVAYGAAPGTAAFESPDAKHGQFTQSLLKHMVTPGIMIEQVFKRVRSDVERDSRLTQSPSEESKLRGDQEFSFVDPGLAKARKHGRITRYTGRSESVTQQSVLAPQRDLFDRIQTIPAPSRIRALRELIATRAPKLSADDAERILSYFWVPARRRALVIIAPQLPASMPLPEVTRLIAKSTFQGYRETSMLPRETFEKLKSLGKVDSQIQFAQLEAILRTTPLADRCAKDSTHAARRDENGLEKEASDTPANRKLLEIVEDRTINLDEKRALIKALFKSHRMELRFAEVRRILQALPEEARVEILTQDITSDALPDLLTWEQLTAILTLIKGDGSSIGDQGLQRQTTVWYFIDQGMLDANLSRQERAVIDTPLREELQNMTKRIVSAQTNLPAHFAAAMASANKQSEDMQIGLLLDPLMACH